MQSSKPRRADPNAPKKPLSAYFLFAGDNRALLKEKNPGLTAQELSTVIGIEWATLNSETKNKYQKLANEKKAEYEKVLNIYNLKNQELKK